MTITSRTVLLVASLASVSPALAHAQTSVPATADVFVFDRSHVRGVPARRPHSGPRLRNRRGWPARARRRARSPGPGVEPPGHSGHVVPHRLDDQGLHGAHAAEAARRREAPARRARGDVRSRAARLEVPDAGLAAHPRPRAVEPQRRVRHRRSVGRPADAAAGARVLATAARGRAFRAHAATEYEYSNWATRCSGASSPTFQGIRTRTRSSARAPAAGHGVVRLRRRRRSARAAGARLPLAGRRLARSSRRWRTVPSARWADCRPAPSTMQNGWRICCRRGRRATTRTRGRCGARRCASSRRARTSLVCGSVWAHRGGCLPAGGDVRNGYGGGGRLRPRAHAQPRRRLPRLRIARAAAAGPRRRRLRLGQPDLRGPFRARVGCGHCPAQSGLPQGSFGPGR